MRLAQPPAEAGYVGVYAVRARFRNPSLLTDGRMSRVGLAANGQRFIIAGKPPALPGD